MKQIGVVGGSGSLGNAVVQQLIDRNYDVVVIGRANASDRRVRQFYAADAITTDWPSLYQRIARGTGKGLDGLVFVSGTASYGRTELFPMERARQIFELNYWTCTSAARAAAKYWTDEHRPGTFLAVLSIVARRAVPFEAYYASSKAATQRFLECLNLEYQQKNIQFLSAFPGMLRTPFRRSSEWYGIPAPTCDEGADVHETAKKLVDLLEGKRRVRVIGWREQVIDLADRFFPGLYDRAVLRNRVAKLLDQPVAKRNAGTAG
jgi:short-subunit dehydrogenase